MPYVAPEITRSNLNAHMDSGRKKKWSDLVMPKDKFGRQYVCQIDRNSGDPVSTIERRFLAPVDVPDKYMRVPQDARWRMELDLEAYVRDLRLARKEWERLGAEMMKKLYKELAYDEHGAVKPPTQQVLELIGEPPQDWRIVELLRRGDRWCLGLQAQRTAAVRAILGDKPFQSAGADTNDDGNFDLGDELEGLVDERELQASRYADEDATQTRRARVRKRAGATLRPGDGPDSISFGRTDGRRADDDSSSPLDSLRDFEPDDFEGRVGDDFGNELDDLADADAIDRERELDRRDAGFGDETLGGGESIDMPLPDGALAGGLDLAELEEEVRDPAGVGAQNGRVAPIRSNKPQPHRAGGKHRR